MSSYAAFYRQSIDERDAFWAEQARRIDWHTPPQTICDYSHPPFARWFAGGTTNLCHNAVDRHLAARAQQNALVAISTETDTERAYTYAELHAEVQRMAAVLQALGVRQGDRVLLYMPMIAEAAFAMLACARIGAIHSVVFGGFASGSLASRIEDAEPLVVVSADAGSRGGKVVPYKPLLDEAIELSRHKPAAVLMVDRGLAGAAMRAGRDHDWAALRAQHLDAQVPCTWVDATHPSYTLYTSGTTGRPKGVQRDTGGYAVALAASMRHIFQADPGDTYLCTSDIGWVVGHSYIIYGPLIAGMTTIMYEGLPIRPDAGIWWSLVEKYRVTHMFSAPTAVRVLKKQDPSYLSKYDLRSLKALWLAGEPLDEPTAQWIGSALGVPIIHRLGTREIEECIASHPNVAEVAVVGVADALKGQVALAFAVPKNATGLEAPEARLHLEGEVMELVDARLGAVARPARVHFVTALPKTRSGKVLRRALQAVAERRDPGDLTTMEDPAALAQVKALVTA